MDAPEKRMNDHDADDDCFCDIFNGLDLAVDSFEGDALCEDWASKLGPIPAEVFPGADLFSSPNVEASQAKLTRILNKRTSFEENKTNPLPRSFEAPSPDSVLGRGNSDPTRKPMSITPDTSVPIRTRTKRSKPRSTTNPWLKLGPITTPLKQKGKSRCLSEQPDNSLETKKCTHCEITKTPQWREGPLGPKTLCNACGVRYRSGRLFPEYRPAASPTFIPSVHSNSHRKVIEMRQKGVAIDDSCVMMMKKEHLGLGSTRNCSSE